MSDLEAAPPLPAGKRLGTVAVVVYATFALLVENTIWVLQYDIGHADYLPIRPPLSSGAPAMPLAPPVTRARNPSRRKGVVMNSHSTTHPHRKGRRA